MNYGILPLDSRPIHTSQLQVFCQQYSIQADVFPSSELGTKDLPADFNRIIHWLEATNYDEYILSVNALCCGGLVQSRNLNQTHIDNAARLTQILKNKRFRLGLVLPRLAPTVTSRELIKLHAMVSAQEATCELDDNQILLWKQFLQTLPPIEGIVQEDTCNHSPYAYALHSIVKEYQPQHKYYANGGDELLYLMLAHSVYPHPTKINLLFAYPQYKNQILKFEHLPLSDNVSYCCNYLNIGFSSSFDSSLSTVLVNNSPYQALDLLDDASNNEYLQSYPQVNLPEVFGGNQPLYVADVAWANGGDKKIWNMIINSQCKLQAYSGWNTAMNSLGTLLATAKLEEALKNNIYQPNQWLLLRILDDYIYQTLVRPKLIEISTQANIDYWSLQENDINLLKPYTEQWMLDEYSKLKSQLSWLKPITKLSISFPWGRLFEIDIDFEC